DVRPFLEWTCQRGLGDARRNGVDANPEAADFGGEALDQEADRSLGRPVYGKPRLDGHSADRGTGDQAATALVHHDAAERLKEPHRTLDVEVDDTVEILLAVVEDGLADVEAGRRDCNIEPAKFLQAAGRKRADGSGTCGIADRSFGDARLRADAGSRRLCTIARNIGADHAGAESGQRLRRRFADPRGGAEHDGGFAGEIEQFAVVGHGLLLCSGARLASRSGCRRRLLRCRLSQSGSSFFIAIGASYTNISIQEASMSARALKNAVSIIRSP